MREIKFKLYHKRTNQMYMYDPRWGNFSHGGGWIGGVLLEDYEREGRTFSPSNQCQLSPDECEWLQFTGLHDKQGNEIYEGDIFKGTHANYPIAWHGEGRWSASIGYSYIPTVDWRKYEVIGNIHRNPELLEVS